jgi:DNA modification methylase
MTIENPSALSIVYEPVVALTPYSKNARTHTKRQIRQIAHSIRTFGFTNPILIDRDNRIIAGHGRVEGAKVNGMTDVPTIRLEGLSEDQIRAYVIADNKLAENAGWDKSILAIELQYLLTIQGDLDVTITGFEVPEIDLIVQEAGAATDQVDTVDLQEVGPAVTQTGDIWNVGKHRVLCGSSLHDSSFSALLGKEKASMVFADPPYNVPIDGHATGNGVIKHRNFAMACGEMREAEFISFLTTSFSLLGRYSLSGSIQFICMDWRHTAELLSAGKQVYNSLLNMCVWAKDTGGMGSLYRSQHELVFVFRNGKDSHRNNVQLGRYGRNRTNVWRYPGANTFSKQGEEGNLLALHPTVKPVALIADAILDCSAPGDIVLDSFLGSGSTLLAAERVGRVCYGIDIDPLYVDVAIRRWQRYTGDSVVHATSGKSFDQIESEAVHG